MESGVVTNSALYNCLHILKHRYALRPSLAGFGSFGVDELYYKLRRYRETHKRCTSDMAVCASSQACPLSHAGVFDSTVPSTLLPNGIPADIPQVNTNGATVVAPSGISSPETPVRYYVAALDLEKCYDNVDTSLLFDLVVNLLSAEREEEIPGSAGSRGGCIPSTDRGMGSRSKSGIHDGDGAQEEGSEVCDDGDGDDGYLVHRYSVAHYISR